MLQSWLPSSASPSPEEIWSAAFAEICQLITPCFGKSETRQRAQAYLRGLLSPVKRKNGGQLAEEAGESTPYAMQYLLDRAVGAVPRNYGKNTTLIASLSLAGMGEALLLEGAADACAFEVYMEQVLTANKQISSLPRLQEGMQERPGCSPDAVARF